MKSPPQIAHSVKDFAKSLLDAAGLLGPVSRLHLRTRQRIEVRKTLRLYRQFIKANDLCFDVGANIGDLSGMMLSLGARVVAIEPQVENVDTLELRFGREPNFILVSKAVGAKIGFADLLVCSSSDCSSLSAEFVEAVQRSGRLDERTHKWAEVRRIPTTTLDQLIDEYGLPSFMKIDVEGLEDEVLKGCTQRLRALSFEFTPERLQPALTSIELLERLGPVLFNYTFKGRSGLQLRRWATGSRLADELRKAQGQPRLMPSGDVYARFNG
jgi:FkbM family methyltransferase